MLTFPQRERVSPCPKRLLARPRHRSVRLCKTGFDEEADQGSIIKAFGAGSDILTESACALDVLPEQMTCIFGCKLHHGIRVWRLDLQAQGCLGTVLDDWLASDNLRLITHCHDSRGVRASSTHNTA